ncbi:pseudouridine synthase [Corynebacterium frankenforstense DSM 45800]|uniref:tRNA pseudouridine synthase B n=1 Tax=Corynebacterium frankenforstense DSM 45800 TaxID=1437875 RepID=A0A1L7CTC9_9CORY|nr:tRNA pseudouridine(55) synthase TruB [Corynebacterium frankenforstense]APT89087.1 pseudouridine synthase [Corynebacterium frankenforstense DSM 45800]
MTASSSPAASADPLADSGLVVVDKPAGMSSHDVVAKVRRAMGTRKVGHAGTLDPMATGVLVLGVNRGTKFLAHLTAATKSYSATVRLGERTTTDDAEGETTARTTPLDDAALVAAVADLTGDIMQVPATVSAIKVDGRRAYARARAGEDVELPARPVTVSRFDVLSRAGDDVEVEVDCSTGTYIRALARDLGGHLTRLRRTEVGPFTLADAVTLEELAEQPALSLSVDEAMTRCYPTLPVDAEEYTALSQGKRLKARGLDGVHAAVGPDGRAVALVAERGGALATVFVARPSTL